MDQPPHGQQQHLLQMMAARQQQHQNYQPGMCARRLTQYMYHQQHRPKDNNIAFWRKFVADFFAPHAKKKWCFSTYATARQTTALFPQDLWLCQICHQNPARGFQATVEVLPRLYKIKYDSGTLEELLYVDMPREYPNPSGQIVLDYAKAIQETVFDHLRVVREGQLRIVFSPTPQLKICSWEFCARHHEELIPRRLLIPQVSQLGAAAQKYQVASQNASNLSVPELQNNCNMFVSSARQLAKALEVPLVNDLGYTKRYVRCLQISEVVNSMKDLIDYSRETETGPMESLTKFPRRTNASGFNNQPQQPEEQKQPPITQNTNNDQTSILGNGIQHAGSNSVPNVINSHNSASASASSSAIVGLLHQNSMKQNSSNANSPYGGTNTVPIPNPSPGAQTHRSPFQSPTPTPSSTNNPLPPQPSQNALTTPTTVVNNHMGPTNSQANMSTQQQQPAIAAEAGPNESHGSVQKIIQEMMMSSQLNGGGMVGVNSLGNDLKSGSNGFLSTNSNIGFNGNVMVKGNVENNGGSGIMGAAGYGNIGIRGALGNKSMSMNGRVRVGSMVREQSMNHHQPQNLGNNQLFSGAWSS